MAREDNRIKPLSVVMMLHDRQTTCILPVELKLPVLEVVRCQDVPEGNLISCVIEEISWSLFFLYSNEPSKTSRNK